MVLEKEPYSEILHFPYILSRKEMYVNTMVSISIIILVVQMQFFLSS